MRLRRSPYIPIRNDSQVVSSNELSFVQAALTTHSSLKLRLDGRSLTQLRPARLQLTRAANTGDAACTVTWGSSIQVSCVCQASIVAPSTDRPNEGVVQVSVETSPMASTGFVHGPAVGTVNESGSGGNMPRTSLDDAQKAVSNSILRQLENLLQNCLEVEALVIVPGQWVWQLSLRLTVLDCGSGTSGLLDASVLATLAALRHYRQPCTTLGEQENNHSQTPAPSDNDTNQTTAPGTISLDHKEGTPLPLHHTPLSISFTWLQTDESDGGNASNQQMMADEDDEGEHTIILVDPSWQEQKVCAPNELTLQLSIHGEVCGMVSRGAVTPALLQKCHDLASGSLVPQLSQALERTLQQAHAQAVQEGLQRMKRQQAQQHDKGIAGDEMDVDMTDEEGMDKINDALQAAEESYRKQALEYNLGHQTVAVRDKKQTTLGAGNSRLLQSLLQAVSQQPAPGSEPSKNTDKKATPANMPPTDRSEPKSKAPLDTSGVQVLKLKKTTDDADIQFEDTAPKPPPKLEVANLSSDDDEEEETTTQLKTEFDEVAEFNRQELEAEEEEAFWEDNRNTNRESTGSGKRGFGPDKIKGGRVAPPPEVPREDGKPNLKKKNRQLAKRKQQQMKAMQKKSGAT